MLLLDAAEAENIASDVASNVTEAIKEATHTDFFKDYFADFPAKALNVGIRIVLAALVFVIGIFVIKLIRKILKGTMKKCKADVGVTGFVDSFAKVALYILLIFLIASYFGVDAASIVAIVGSAGVAIGLAVQGSLSNLAGGVLILLLKPFKIGDYIKDNSTGKEGVVNSIHIFYTKLTTVDNQVVILPNGSLANSAITNVSGENTRRIDVTVEISYSDSIDTAREVITELMNSDKRILDDHEKKVLVAKLGESGVELDVRFWVAASDYWDTFFDMNENVKKVLDKAGIEIPYRQIDVHMK